MAKIYNIDYLMNHISYQLHTYVRKYSKKNNKVKKYCGIEDFSDILSKHPSLYHKLLKSSLESYPTIFLINQSIVYAVVCTYSDYLIIGPLRFISKVKFTHNILDAKSSSFLFDDVSCCEVNTCISHLLLLHNFFNNEYLKTEDIFRFNFIQPNTEKDIQKKFSNTIFYNQEYGTKHNPYDQEIREINSIRAGDINQLKRSWSEDYIGKIGTLASTQLRNNKNLGIVLVTLASRAAMEGGVIPEIAYTLSDSYICKIEESTDPETAFFLGKEAEIQYTLMVQNIKHQKFNTEIPISKNEKIARCKDYIFSHLHKRIYIPEIAAILNIHPNYLSELFKKCEGITITEFILREKITQVKNLLTYSSYSYIEIATYLNFSSQSHLGKQFKRATGLTLKQYKDKYSIGDAIIVNSNSEKFKSKSVGTTKT